VGGGILGEEKDEKKRYEKERHLRKKVKVFLLLGGEGGGILTLTDQKGCLQRKTILWKRDKKENLRN